jgi:hypothetical protein
MRDRRIRPPTVHMLVREAILITRPYVVPTDPLAALATEIQKWLLLVRRPTQ